MEGNNSQTAEQGPSPDPFGLFLSSNSTKKFISTAPRLPDLPDQIQIGVEKVSVSSVQLLSRVWLFATPGTAARQASLSITHSHSLLKLTSIESVMPSNHLILCRPLLLPPSIFPSIRSFQMSQFFASGGQSIEASASASVLPMNIQDWFPLGWTIWSPCSPRDSQESSPTPQFKRFKQPQTSSSAAPPQCISTNY